MTFNSMVPELTFIPGETTDHYKKQSNMPKTHRILSVLLVLMLVGSNMAFSSHVSAHIALDSSTCSLCIAPGGSDCAIASDPGAFQATPFISSFILDYSTTRVLPVIFYAHQSRAPPRLS